MILRRHALSKALIRLSKSLFNINVSQPQSKARSTRDSTPDTRHPPAVQIALTWEGDSEISSGLGRQCGGHSQGGGRKEENLNLYDCGEQHYDITSFTYEARQSRSVVKLYTLHIQEKNNKKKTTASARDCVCETDT